MRRLAREKPETGVLPALVNTNLTPTRGNGVQHFNGCGRQMDIVRAIVLRLLARHRPHALVEIEFRALQAGNLVAPLCG